MAGSSIDVQTTDSEALPRGSTSPAEGWLESVNPRLLWTVFGLLLCLILGPRLFRSFWVDETGTYWMAEGGPWAAIQKTLAWPGQSVLFAFLQSFFVVPAGALRECILRIPALVGGAVSCYFIFRLAESAVGKSAGFAALVLFAFHPTVLQLDTQARPYSLALAAVIASCWFLMRWVATSNVRYLLGYVVASTLIIYFHYFFAIIFVTQAMYLLYAVGVERRRLRWSLTAGAFASIGVLILPLVPHIRLLLREAHTLPFVEPPKILELTEFLVPSILIFGVLMAALIFQFAFPRFLQRPPQLPGSILVLFMSWWFVGPALFFAASIATPMRVFLPRYLAFSLPAQALLFAYTGYAVFGAIGSRFWAVLAVLLSTASPLSFWAARHSGFEELKPFLDVIHQESKSSLPPVFYSSPLPESNFYDWQHGLAGLSRLYAPFLVYPIPNRLLPLPYKLTDPVREQISSVIDTQLADESEVLFITHEPPDWNPWMIDRMAKAGFQASTSRPNGYSIVIFKR